MDQCGGIKRLVMVNHIHHSQLDYNLIFQTQLARISVAMLR